MSHDAAPALLVAAAAILVAALGLRASIDASSASGALASSVRVEVASGAADVQDALLVFDEAPAAARAAAGRFRSEELQREAEENPALASQLILEAAVAGALAQALGGGDEALEVDRRLAQRRGEQQDDDSAAALAAEGDDTGRRAALAIAVGIPAALAFLLGSIGQALPRRRGLLVSVGAAALLVSLAGGIWLELAR